MFANPRPQRVVEGQRLTQAASDILLGWVRFTAPDGVGRDFYMRSACTGKGSALVELDGPSTLMELVTPSFCGEALAKAHAGGDAVAIAGYLRRRREL